MNHRNRHIAELRFLKRVPALGLIGIILLISLIIGVSWVFLLPALQEWSGLSAEHWDKIDALTSVAAFSLAIGTGVIVLIELVETTDSHNLAVYRDIYDKMMSDEEIEARQFLYNLPAADAEALRNRLLDNPEEHRAFKRVLNTIDYFGFLVDQQWVTADAIIGWVSPIVVKVWDKIGPIVELECARRPEEPDYYLAARQLAARCAAWRDAHHADRERSITFSQDHL